MPYLFLYSLYHFSGDTNDAPLTGFWSSTERSEKTKLFDFKYVIKISLLTFFISVILSYISNTTLSASNVIIALIIIIIIVFIGILSDMVGVAVISANIKSFHSMAAKKIRGAKIGSELIKNADKVSNITNDVMGDICGIVSGAASVVLSGKLILFTENIYLKIILPLIITAIVASVTIGGKGLGKSIAIRFCDKIIMIVARLISFFKKEG